MKRFFVCLGPSLFSLLNVTSSIPAIAGDYSWTPVVACGDSSGLAGFEIDSRTEYYATSRSGPVEAHTTYQIVLRNPEIIDYFVEQGAIFAIQLNSKGEFILGMAPDALKGKNSYYGMDFGITKTVSFSEDRRSLELKAYGPKAGQKLADFTFNDCH